MAELINWNDEIELEITYSLIVLKVTIPVEASLPPFNRKKPRTFLKDELYDEQKPESSACRSHVTGESHAENK